MVWSAFGYSSVYTGCDLSVCLYYVHIYMFMQPLTPTMSYIYPVDSITHEKDFFNGDKVQNYI